MFIVLALSFLMAALQAPLRHAIWTLFNFAAAFFAFLCRSVLTFANFLSARISEAIDGLSEEGQYRKGEPRPWVGWFIVGPIIYCALMLVFMASDLTVAILIFEAMGLTLGATARSTIPIPLDAAMGVVFVALAVFWGIVLFDLLQLTPFQYIWSGLQDQMRRRLVRLVLACLSVTLLAGLTMGVWSQAQLTGGLPQPWQTVVPWFIRGSLVSLLICATAVSGKPFGSALTAVLVVALLLVRAASFLVLVALRFVVVLLRQLIHIPLALLAFVAVLGQKLWNWLVGFGWAKRLRLVQLANVPVPEVGGDSDNPLVFRSAGDAVREAADVAARNKLLMKRMYEEVFPSAGADLDEFFAPDVVHHDARNGAVSGLEPLRKLLAEMQSAFADLRISVDDQVAEADRVVSRLRLLGIQRDRSQAVPAASGNHVSLMAVDSVRLEAGKVVERWGIFQPMASGPSANGDSTLLPIPVATAPM